MKPLLKIQKNSLVYIEFSSHENGRRISNDWCAVQVGGVGQFENSPTLLECIAESITYMKDKIKKETRNPVNRELRWLLDELIAKHIKLSQLNLFDN